MKRLVGSVLRQLPPLKPYFHVRDLKYDFYRRFGYIPDASNPKTFSEKLYRRKLLGDPRFARLADKVLVKEYVRELIGEQFVIPTLYAGPTLTLARTWPLPFVIKCNHGSAMNIFVRNEDECDWHSIERKINQWLEIDYSKPFHERFYADIRRQVLVEPFIGDNGKLPIDYKFLVFNGQPKLIQVDLEREGDHRRVIFDQNWKRQSFCYTYPNPTDNRCIFKPKSLNTMLEAASKLAQGFDFVRVDFYEVNGKPYFGEMTFTPAGGFETFDPPEADLWVGQMWN